MSPLQFFIGHRAEILQATATHLTLVLIAMAIAVLIALITPQWLQEEVNTSPRPLGNTLSSDWRAILPVVKGPC